MSIGSMTRVKAQKFNLTNNHIAGILIIVYLLFRIPNLTLIPIFNDESTYLDWGFRHVNLEGEFFHSVKHAKPPLLMWIFGLAQKIFSDPLVAGRLVSVATGLVTAFGLYKIANELFNRRVATISYFLYTISPIFVFYDRQALMESAIAAVGVWSFYILNKSTRSDNIKYPLILGTMLAIGYFIKSNAFVFVFSIFPIYLLSTKFKQSNTNSIINKTFFIFLTFFAVLAPLILQETFWSSLGQNSKYILTPSELAALPFAAWLKNIFISLEILAVYFNPLILLFAFIGIYKIVRSKHLESIYLLVWLVTGIALTVFLGKTMQIRHLVSYLPLVVIFASYSLDKIFSNTKIPKILSYTSLVPTLAVTLLLLFYPLSYFDLLDKFSNGSLKKQYVTHWSSGYGIPETINYLKDVSKNGRIVVGVRLDAGNPENAVFTYFNKSINIQPAYLDSKMISEDTLNNDCLQSQIPIYFVSRDNNYAGLDKLLSEIQRFGKPEGENYIAVHKVKVCKN